MYILFVKKDYKEEITMSEEMSQTSSWIPDILIGNITTSVDEYKSAKDAVMIIKGIPVEIEFNFEICYS